MKDRLFLDANVLFSVAWRKESGLLQLWSVKNAALLTSQYAQQEAERNLHELHQHKRLIDLLASVEIVSEAFWPYALKDISLREKDQPILSAAIAANATHLITGDFRDFGAFYGQELGGVLILPPAAYLSNRAIEA